MSIEPNETVQCLLFELVNHEDVCSVCITDGLNSWNLDSARSTGNGGGLALHYPLSQEVSLLVGVHRLDPLGKAFHQSVARLKEAVCRHDQAH